MLVLLIQFVLKLNKRLIGGCFVDINNVCASYFNGFHDIYHCKENTFTTNALALIKIISYFTALIPIGFGVVYGLSSLIGRINKRTDLSEVDRGIVHQANKQLSQKELKKDLTITPNAIQLLHEYSGDLEEIEKKKLGVSEKDANTLAISFLEFPDVSFTVRNQDLFQSGAEVIVNAANTHLGGGSGIDGAIHQKGGLSYQNAHKALKAYYKDGYTRGYAAMIESGDLKKDHGIDHVIVVAGPKGKNVTSQETKELYSCYYNSLELAHREHKTKIAFPSIGTGLFGFPLEVASEVSIKAVYDFIKKYPDTALKTISIHFTTPKGLEVYKAAVNGKLSQ